MEKAIRVELVSKNSESIIAYHGSPKKDIDKFDVSYTKQQMYGYGLYFTFDKNVASEYGIEQQIKILQYL